MKSKTIIYHNPRCSKSRQCLALISDEANNIEVVNYMKDPISEEKLREILKMLGIQPAELVRTNETIWKENFKGKELSDDQIISAMLEHPKLIERPIVVKDGEAKIGRPPESVLTLFK